MGMDSESRGLSKGQWLINGCRNIGVLQTTVAEIVTVKEHQRKFENCAMRSGLTTRSSRLCHHAFCLVSGVRGCGVQLESLSELNNTGQSLVRPLEEPWLNLAKTTRQYSLVALSSTNSLSYYQILYVP